MKIVCLSTAALLALSVSLFVCSPLVRAGDKNAEVETLRKALASSDDNARYKALVGLQDLGPKAAAAAPDSVKLFTAKNEDVRLNAALALGKIGKAAVPELRTPLTSADEDVRYYALSAVGWIGPDAKDIAPQVIGSLNHKSESVRRKAAYALGSIAAAPADAVAALVKLLADPNADVRKASSDALARFGAQAVPVLLKSARHPDLALRVGVIRALGGMGADAKDAIPLLEEALLANDFKEHKQAGASAAAADALARIGKASLAALSAGVKSPHADVRHLSVAALGKVGGDAVPLLVDALGDTHVDVRRQAAQVLGPMRISDKMIVLGLAYALKDQDEPVRLHAAIALSWMGAGAKLATLHLLDALQDGSDNVRASAANALRIIRPDSPEVFKKLTQLARANNSKTRQAALTLLTPFGADALPLVFAGLKDADHDVRRQAVTALSSLQGDLSEALPLLLPLLKSNDAALREGAVRALYRVGEKALPHLIDALKDDAPSVRRAAILGLPQFGIAAAKATPVLMERLKTEPDAIVRRFIVGTLLRVGPEGQTALLAVAKGNPDNVLRRNVLLLLNTSKGAVPSVEAKIALPFLIASLKDNYLTNRSLACNILGNYGAAAKEALPALTEMANDANQKYRFQAQAALKRIQQ